MRQYTGDARRAVAFPLGGIGTGHVALGGDGALRQWSCPAWPTTRGSCRRQLLRAAGLLPRTARRLRAAPARRAATAAPEPGPERQRRRRARRRPAAVLVELTGRAKDKVKGYSLGMKQRLGIAGTLLNQPQVIFLDEPTNGLTPRGR